MTQMGFLGLTRGDNLGYTDYMPGNTTTIALEQAREMLADIEHSNHYLAWLLSTIEVSSTPYKQGDLYKEIIDGNGWNPPNES